MEAKKIIDAIKAIKDKDNLFDAFFEYIKMDCSTQTFEDIFKVYNGLAHNAIDIVYQDNINKYGTFPVDVLMFNMDSRLKNLEDAKDAKGDKVSVPIAICPSLSNVLTNQFYYDGKNFFFHNGITSKKIMTNEALSKGAKSNGDYGYSHNGIGFIISSQKRAVSFYKALPVNKYKKFYLIDEITGRSERLV